ncbi:4098_t:CDS:2 [Paraglomus occultum]|uniref:4098_t:CDS:1 n=1 Tax=Paraglomus occultum TaxID=144539 RepID=A0A9N8Z359_9GLOM|nr:4098_t:CDS:2 [Paraglomus occultum]
MGKCTAEINILAQVPKSALYSSPPSPPHSLSGYFSRYIPSLNVALPILSYTSRTLYYILSFLQENEICCGRFASVDNGLDGPNFTPDSAVTTTPVVTTPVPTPVPTPAATTTPPAVPTDTASQSALQPSSTISTSQSSAIQPSSSPTSVPVPCIPDATTPGNLTCTDTNSFCNTTSQLCNAKLANDSPCSSDIECLSGSCNNNVCSDGQSDAGSTATTESGSKSNTLIKVAITGGVVGLVAVLGLAFWAIRSRRKKQSGGYKSGGPGIAPSVYNDATSLNVEKRTSNGGYPFSAPYTGFSSNNIQEPASARYVNSVQASNRVNDQEGYVDQRMMTDYNTAQNTDQNGGFSNNDGNYYSDEYNNSSFDQRSPPTFPPSAVVVPIPERQLREGKMSDNDSGHNAKLDLAIAARDLLKQGTGNPEVMLNGDAVSAKSPRDSNGSYISNQDDDNFLTTEPMYLGIDNFAEDDMRTTKNKTANGRYKMQSMYSRDSTFFAGAQNAPPNPRAVQRRSSSKRTLDAFGAGDAGSDYSDDESIISVSRVPQASVSTQHAPIFKSYQASAEDGSNMSERYRHGRN